MCDFCSWWGFRGEGKEKEDSDNGNKDRSRFLGETMREGWQEMATLCGKMSDAE